MTDVHSPVIRCKNMRAIRRVNTLPEVFFRKLLHNAGYRYRITPNKLPSKPDLYLARFQSVILVNGCFWHRHTCNLFHWPKSRPEFWRKKINETVQRDRKNIEALNDLGIKVLIVWECAIKGKKRLPRTILLSLAERWLKGYKCNGQIDSQGLTLSKLS